MRKGFGGETEGKRLVARSRRTWTDNIKIILKISDGRA
jgi:hypothetical protein